MICSSLSPLRQILHIFIMALIFTAIACLPINPRRLAWNRLWADATTGKIAEHGLTVATMEETARAIEEGSRIVLDARNTQAYHEGHLPTAMSLPVVQFAEAFGSLAGLLTSFDDPILVYCGGADCDESVELAVKLRDVGYTNLLVFTGGFEEWKASGRPIE